MNNRKVVGSLIILGGILGLLSACVSLLSVPLMAGLLGSDYVGLWEYARVMGQYGMIGYPNFGQHLWAIMIAWSFLSFVGGFLAVYGGCRVVRGLNASNETLASASAVLLLLAFSWLPAVMVTVGCFILILYKA